MKQGQCICPLSWSVHCNFTGEGKCNKRGWACNPHPHQPGLILPSSLNVRQKAAVATLCTLWVQQRRNVVIYVKHVIRIANFVIFINFISVIHLIVVRYLFNNKQLKKMIWLLAHLLPPIPHLPLPATHRKLRKEETAC
jgi:hypothetical protein